MIIIENQYIISSVEFNGLNMKTRHLFDVQEQDSIYSHSTLHKEASAGIQDIVGLMGLRETNTNRHFRWNLQREDFSIEI